MVNFNDVNANVFVEKLSEEMKKISEIVIPEWAKFVKTGPNKERLPDNPDWWYLRSASVLRKIAILGPVGVSKLRVKYGGRKNRGTRPEKFVRSGGKIIRVTLQQLEKAQLIKKVDKGIHKGRIITAKGLSLLDKTAVILIKNMPQPREELVKVELRKEMPVKELKPVQVRVENAPVKTEAKKELVKPEIKKEIIKSELKKEITKPEPKKEIEKIQEKKQEKPEIKKEESVEQKPAQQ
jgi:small subunit ribosomal protein S19e